MKNDRGAENLSAGTPLLTERTIGGVHDFILREVLHRFSPDSGPAVDLGAGSGALAVRLRDAGWDVRSADIDPQAYKADVPFVKVDLNEANFSARLGEKRFGLITAVEVIEHVESPIGFLRNVTRLLKPEGVAVLTTPNVDNAPARLKFFLTGKLRMMDEKADPTHISPIFWDLLQRQYLPRVGLRLVDHLVYPPNGYKVTRARYAWGIRLLAWLLAGECLKGDNHVFVLQPGESKWPVRT
jgi:SAM-dependent methyltransferase